MAIIGINLSELHAFRSALDDADEDHKTVFWYSPLDANVRAMIDSQHVSVTVNSEGKQVHRFATGSNYVTAIKFALRKWERFMDPENSGAEVPLRFVTESVAGKLYNVVHPDCISMIPTEVLSELGQDIFAKCTLSEIKRKNSQTP